MSELPSAMFLIADGSEFRFARFYIVCEEVPLGTPESPPIVSGVSDMHPADCQNVEETRNLMQTSDRKECSHFFQKNFLLPFTQNRVVCFLLLSARRGGNRYNSAGREDLLAKDTGTVWSGIIS